ncbi:MAG: transglutaminase-like domain-containing protein [Nanoarchaeota archaeon]
MNLKKTLVTIVATAMLYAGAPGMAEAYRPVRGRTLETYVETKDKTDTPAKIWAFFKTSIKYASDKEGKFKNHKGEERTLGNDYMQDPIDTYLRGKGDCDDYAALAHDWLKEAGYETKMISYFAKGKKTGHAICAIKDDGKWSYLGCDNYKKGYTRIEELVAKNEPNWAVYYELTLDQTRPTGDRASNEVYRNEAAKKEWERYIKSQK